LLRGLLVARHGTLAAERVFSGFGAQEEEMDFESAVVIGTFPNHETAEAIVSLLASEKIEAVLQSDDAGGELPNLDLGRGIRVYVKKEDAEFAKGLINVDAAPSTD
jgi:hypothetical protein